MYDKVSCTRRKVTICERPCTVNQVFNFAFILSHPAVGMDPRTEVIAVGLGTNYQRDVFADFVPESGLLVMGRGLGLHSMVKNLVKLYANEKFLVFLLGASLDLEEEIQGWLTNNEAALVNHIPFKVIRNDTPARERAETYLHGGVISITSRIMLIDLLRERIPVAITTGILVLSAEYVSEFCIEAFILHLYREANKEGFIKAFSERADALVGGFSRVEKTLKFLRVDKLFLYPRFHQTVKEDLDEVSLDVEELHVPMTNKMKIIQLGLMEVIEACLRELTKANPSLEDVTTQAAIMASFDVHLRRQLDPIWHRISLKSKQLVGELRTLRLLLDYLVSYDAIAFCKFLETLVMADASSSSTGTALRSYWLLLGTAQTIIQTAKDRVYTVDKTNGALRPAIEAHPKWRVVKDVIRAKRIDVEDQRDTDEKACPRTGTTRTLIMVGSEQTRRQVTRILASGNEQWQERKFADYLRWKKSARSVGGLEHGIAINPATAKMAGVRRRRFVPPTGSKTSVVEQPSAPEDEAYSNMTLGEADEDYLSLTALPDNILVSCYADDSSPIGDRNTIDYQRLLEEFHPQHVIMYDSDLAFLRALEVYRATDAGTERLKLSLLLYSESIEEQRQLLAIRREKEAFEILIKSKATMVPLSVESLNQGRDDGDLFAALASNKFTGGQAGLATPSPMGSLIIDMRELRSSLPFILHRHGFLLEPHTIDTGDYVLSPDICVERKSVSDLIGSLNSGRLYLQTEALCRQYKQPLLLIEFDERRPFSLLSGEVRPDVSINDTSSKLCLLLLHFPRLRLIWSSSLAQTAEIFRELKRDQPDPTVGVGGEEGVGVGEWDPVARGMLFALPGINTSNGYLTMRHVRCMRDLCRLSQDQLQDLIGTEDSRKLYKFLHEPLVQGKVQPQGSPSGG